MEKFILDEAFDVLYNQFLEESVSEQIKELNEDIDRNQQYFMNSLQILTEFTRPEVGATLEATTDEIEKDMKEAEEKAQKKEEQTEQNNKPYVIKIKNDVPDTKKENVWDTINKTLDMYDKMQARAKKEVEDTFSRDKKMTYSPEPQFLEVQKMSEMPFPKNILFFIKQLILWIKNNIINFIDKFSNIVRSLFGLKASEPKFTPEQLKLKMEKAKEMETKYIAVSNSDVYKPNDNIENRMNALNGYGQTYSNAVKPIRLLRLKPEDVKLIESYLVEEKNDNILNEAAGDTVSVISIDTSKDLLDLKLTLQHFFDLFDNAFGSNNEKLFATDDLLIMLSALKSSTELLEKGFSKGGMEINGNQLIIGKETIDASKIKNNLLRTKINVDNLKKAYVATNNQINVITKIIMNKNILGVTQLGVRYAFLSAASYGELSEMLEIIDNRLTEAKNMEKDLKKMKTSFENLTTELEKKRTAIAAIRKFTFTTILEKSLENLYDSSRYMTQVVQLRLNALSLYLSELNDTRAILKNMNAVNEMYDKNSMTSKAGSLKNKLKQLFAK